MLKWIWASFLIAPAIWAADIIQLKESAAVAGKILANKKDSVAVDIGYTVLVIPKAQITSIQHESAKKENVAVKNAPEKKANAPATASGPAPAVVPAESDTASATRFYQSARTGSQERSVRDLVDVLGESVVQVRTPSGLGSGFFINEDGYLITNFHVTEGETQISIEVYQQKNGQLDRHIYKQVRIIALNKYADLALLKIEDKGSPKFAKVYLGDSEALAVGERVFAIGSPLGLERTVTEGILSTKTREMGGELYLQTTAQINPGNSGGPLFNMRGEVIGVTNMKITFGEGLGFAIPVELVKYFLNHRDSFAYDNDNPSNPYRYLEPPRRVKAAGSGGQ